MAFGQLTNSQVYYQDQNLVGLAKTVKFDKIAWKTIDHETLGQVAVLTTATRTLEPVKGSIAFDYIDESFGEIAFDPTKVHNFQIHSEVSIWGADGLDGESSYTLITSVGLQFLSTEIGEFKLGEMTGSEHEFSVFRLSQKVAGEDRELFSLDVLASKVGNSKGPIWNA